MRKSYKPQSKQNKLTNTYRKKTIDPGVDLDVKKDNDNLDNIDDYWDMAEYVMEDANSDISQKNVPREAQKLIKKNKKLMLENVESSVIEDAMDILTDGTKDTSANSTLFDIDGIRDNVSSNKLKNSSSQNNTSVFGVNFDAIETETANSSKLSLKEIKKDSPKIMKSKNLKKEEKKSEKKNDDFKKIKKTSEKKNEKKLSLKSKILENKNNEIFKGEVFKNSDGEILGLSKISSLYQGKSKLEPLITKKSLESGILFLESGSSIIREKADVSFTILVLKGTIKIKTNEKDFILKRESCFYIEEGMIYDIENDGDTEIKLFITFKAK